MGFLLISVGDDESGTAGGAVDGGGDAGPANGLGLGGSFTRGLHPMTSLALLLRCL